MCLIFLEQKFIFIAQSSLIASGTHEISYLGGSMELATSTVETANAVLEKPPISLTTQKTPFEEVLQKLDALPRLSKKELVSHLFPEEGNASAKKWLKELHSAVISTEPGSFENLQLILPELMQTGEQNQALILAWLISAARMAKNDIHEEFLIGSFKDLINSYPQLASIDYAAISVDTSVFPEVLNKYLDDNYPIIPRQLQKSIKIDYTLALYALGIIGSIAAGLFLYQKGWSGQEPKFPDQPVQPTIPNEVFNITKQVAEIQNKTQTGEFVFIRNETNSSSFIVRPVNLTGNVANSSTGNSSLSFIKTTELPIGFGKTEQIQPVVIINSSIPEKNDTYQPNTTVGAPQDITTIQNDTQPVDANITINQDNQTAVVINTTENVTDQNQVIIVTENVTNQTAVVNVTENATSSQNDSVIIVDDNQLPNDVLVPLNQTSGFFTGGNIVVGGVFATAVTVTCVAIYALRNPTQFANAGSTVFAGAANVMKFGLGVATSVGGKVVEISGFVVGQLRQIPIPKWK